jgi:hypothetical protein
MTASDPTLTSGGEEEEDDTGFRHLGAEIICALEVADGIAQQLRDVVTEILEATPTTTSSTTASIGSPSGPRHGCGCPPVSTGQICACDRIFPEKPSSRRTHFISAPVRISGVATGETARLPGKLFANAPQHSRRCHTRQPALC